jgi:shikimate dehydrogenase
LQDRLRKRGLERDPVKLAQWDEYWAEHGDQLCSWTDVRVTELGAPRKRANPMISGTTTLIAHLGYPTHTFKSSLICNPWFETHAIDAVVVPMGIKPEDYPDFFRSVFTLTNIRGALVTMPHKVVTMNLVDEVSPTAQIAGATNAVLRRDDGSLLAEQFDGAGFVRGALRKGFDPHGKRALVVGNGGVGSPIAASLAGLGLAGIGLFDPDTGASDTLAQRISAHYPDVQIAMGSKDPEGYDLIVNATPLGMRDGDPMPVDIDRITPGSYVGDVVLKAGMTPFLQAAKEKGCTVQVGSDMLFEMIPAYLEFFGFGTATAEELRTTAQLSYEERPS